MDPDARTEDTSAEASAPPPSASAPEDPPPPSPAAPKNPLPVPPPAPKAKAAGGLAPPSGGDAAPKKQQPPAKPEPSPPTPQSSTEKLKQQDAPGGDGGATRTASDTEKEGTPGSAPSSGAVRILYIRSMEPSNDGRRVSLLQEAFGASSVSSPSLGTRRTLTAFALAFGVTATLMGSLVLMTFLKSNIIAGVTAVVCFILVSLLAFFLAWRGITQLVVRQAVLQAEAAFKHFRPNVIVASSYGAVVALQMDIPKLPLVLLSPAQDVYYRYMHLRPLISLSDYPYSIVISGSKDAQVPLDDSIRLVETAELGRCRLEVVDDDHAFTTLKADDFRNWVEEAFQKGQEVVRNEANKGNKHFDVSLFEPLSRVNGTESV